MFTNNLLIKRRKKNVFVFVEQRVVISATATTQHDEE